MTLRLLLLSLALLAQGGRGQRRGQRGFPPPDQTPSASAARPGQTAPPAPPTATAPSVEPPPVVTQHTMTVRGRTLDYTATTGYLPIKTDTGETEAQMFYVAYTLNGVPAGTKRPLVFAFNGGPGSASVWLHMGAIGPKRVKLTDEGEMPPPPYQLVDNDDTWLDAADLVFIDPVGTGYSRPTRPELGQKFWGVQGDIQSVGEFIRRYLDLNQRWTSPLFLAGESYGTTRAAGLSGYLIDQGIAFNGVILLSTVLNFETIDFARGNDLPYILFLPTYTATAWYHHKLPADLQRDLKKTLAEVEHWALTDYQTALARGDQLSASERRAVVDRLARYTGLSRTFIEQHDLRVAIFQFTKELLRDQDKTVGRLDSRLTATEPTAAGESPSFDPTEAAIRPPYTALWNEYVRRDLGYNTDREYYILGGGIGRWDWGTAGRGGFPETANALRSAFAKNPYMHLFVGYGYFDLATPYFAMEYTMNHLQLGPELRSQLTLADYEAGHMMYIRKQSLDKLHRDVTAFIANATTPTAAQRASAK